MTSIHLRTPPFDWICEHCGRSSVVEPEHYHSGYKHLAVSETTKGKTALVFTAIACPHETCRELTLAVRLADYKPSLAHAYEIGTAGDAIEEWQLLPDRGGKPPSDEG